MTIKKQQTPLQKLIDQLKAFKEGYKMMGDYPENIDIAIEYAESLLPEEKQMVIEAVNFGANEDPELGEQYFNETFKQ